MTGDGDTYDIRALFDRAIGLAPAQLAALLQSLPQTVCEELKALLQADEGAATFLAGAVDRELPEPAGSGQQFGTFRTAELLGRGGMSSVFKAHRIDGEVAQTVAVKVVDLGWLDPRVLDRFRQERQFLAGLSHPNIARLIDGGTRPDGVAYVAMEYVEGERIDRYCDSHGLGIKERLRLFLPLCDAVDHAHSKLIVHRDLKPSNVLVTADGQPKLLDFGVAKALDATAGGQTQTIALTPNFASPEQARGEDVTTATDVYGLGAVLYFLLTGRAPHQAEGLSTAALQRAICEEPPAKPSSIRPELKGDLENILVKALHTVPSRRYRSARELADDVERFLARRPVLATPDSAAYRLRRFVARNAFACAAAAIAVLAAGAGTGIALYQAHRAQQRFAQVRELANKFIFEFEASIRTTPGTLDARKKMAATARQYLASLAGDARGDASLNRELAESYYRLSEAEYATGENSQWLADLLHCREILLALHDDRNGAPEQRALYVKVLVHVQDYWVDRDPPKAVPYSLEALDVAQVFRRRYPDHMLAWRSWAEANMLRGNTLFDTQQLPAALEHFQQAVRIADEARARFPNEVELVVLRVEAGNRMGNTAAALGRNEDGLRAIDETAALFDPLISGHPENPGWRDLRIKIAVSHASLIRRLARANPAFQPQVLPAFRDVYLMAKENSARNPGSYEALDLQYVVTHRYANQLAFADKPAEALPLLQEAAGVLATISARSPDDHRTLSLRVENLLGQSGYLIDMKRWPEAAAAVAQAGPLMDRCEAGWPDDQTTLDDRITMLAHETAIAFYTGKTAEARASCEKALAAAVRLIRMAKDEANPVSLLADLRLFARKLGLPDPTATKPTASANASH